MGVASPPPVVPPFYAAHPCAKQVADVVAVAFSAVEPSVDSELSTWLFLQPSTLKDIAIAIIEVRNRFVFIWFVLVFDFD